jgi:[acyl-carrier-protein] S-malonyltransferase
MLVIFCPGQGSQKPGFLKSWLEIPEFKKRIQEYSELISLDLIQHGTLSDLETIKDTAIAQPLIAGASIASASLLDLANLSGVAGHSVGEVSAAAIAGVLTEAEAMQLVSFRSKAMAMAAASSEPTAMAAILGGDIEVVLARLNGFNLSAANFNGAGQIVAAGAKTDIDSFVSEGLTGSKVIELNVAGAFHTKYMEPAIGTLNTLKDTLLAHDPNVVLWSNEAGQMITRGSDYLDLLVGQVANSVRWDLCMASMVEAGVSAVIEVSPAGTLMGLAKRSMPGIEIVALKEPKDLEAAQELLNRHTKKA